MNTARTALITITCGCILVAGCAEEGSQTVGQAEPPAAALPTVSDLRSGAVSPAADEGRPSQVSEGSDQALEWDALIPDDYRPDKLLGELDVEELSDDDPRAAEFMAKMKELWDEAPVREDLDGKEIRLPGFVVPVEADEKETTGFLLVPYYGACVHVPPPPANQTVYVVTEAGKGTRPELFDVVWVSGTMSIQRIENNMAEAGYTLYATQIEPYE